ncbi:hypothetical protein KYJ26_16895 [Bacillus sp. MCCB 382]|uniref:hypothetical protein n=1 Tax=Bacillus sp. MCCB 382 TaxID=2860197 RepID=UPI001C5667B9|nr:hypothetical protein [Bacillus sp. MCCB 382]
MISKECTHCKEMKPLENFSPTSHGLGKRVSMCRPCKNSKYGAGTKQINRCISEINGEPAKTCLACENLIPLKDYYDHDLGVGGKRPRCKRCEQEQRDSNRDILRERDREHYRSNRDYYNAKSRRRRAADKGLNSDWSLEIEKEVMAHFQGCALTGSLEDIHFDHVIPICTGFGGSNRKNMIPLKGSLNMSKRNENVFEWFLKNKNRFGLSQEKFDDTISYLARENKMSEKEYREFVYRCHG